MNNRPSLFITVLLLLPMSALHAAAAPAKKPNIIVILTDDHGWADLGANGVRFTHGYVTAPQCTPSRAGLVTGRYQNKFGVEPNFDPMRSEIVTLPERLKSAGYTTGISGKWHLDSGGPKVDGEKVHDPALDGTPFPDVPQEVTENGCRVVLQTEWALEFLKRRAADSAENKPFFLHDKRAGAQLS